MPLARLCMYVCCCVVCWRWPWGAGAIFDKECIGRDELRCSRYMLLLHASWRAFGRSWQQLRFSWHTVSQWASQPIALCWAHVWVWGCTACVSLCVCLCHPCMLTSAHEFFTTLSLSAEEHQTNRSGVVHLSAGAGSSAALRVCLRGGWGGIVWDWLSGCMFVGCEQSMPVQSPRDVWG